MSYFEVSQIKDAVRQASALQQVELNAISRKLDRQDQQISGLGESVSALGEQIDDLSRSVRDMLLIVEQMLQEGQQSEGSDNS